jgi:hypothetical protein
MSDRTPKKRRAMAWPSSCNTTRNPSPTTRPNPNAVARTAMLSKVFHTLWSAVWSVDVLGFILLWVAIFLVIGR